MKRAEFSGLFLGYIIKKIPEWCAEEDIEEGHLNNIQQRLAEHNFEIKKVLTKPRKMIKRSPVDRRVNGSKMER